MKVIKFPIRYSYSCQSCNKIYDSPNEIDYLKRFVSPICKRCLFKLIETNVCSNLRFLIDNSIISYYNHKLLVYSVSSYYYEKYLSSIKAGAKVQVVQNRPFAPCTSISSAKSVVQYVSIHIAPCTTCTSTKEVRK